MMTSTDTYNACKKIEGWDITANFSVGGFEWLAFSKEKQGKMIIISSQKNTVIDCDNGKIEDCNIDFDENNLTAQCDKLPNEELCLVGQYAGKLPDRSCSGEKVVTLTNDKHIMKIYFNKGLFDKKLIYDNYDAYLCGFSYDGNYFVIADDGGIIIMKKTDH